ncbi:MAG: chromosome segregation protein SMC [Clostridiales bacterium]|nr:chromosome segregation protein SMC [Clostridiales bacterium]
MIFKRIDMHGFKSFAEPVSIEFNDGITCIVGPNGSGKSNISDAIRWVLGEQSPKMLRGGKMEEVIFAGTASRKSRGMAEVTLVIDNGTGILPIDYSEVAITRRMYRLGESEYSINNNPCRLRDIRGLIMDTGIGVDGYSLIGQGKIADIVSSKPESRREIFEEAAGIVTYRSKKAESEKKLDAASSNLERVNDIVAEIESRIDSLKEESEKAAEYLTLRERYKTLEINITLKNIENLELKNEYVADEILEATNEVDEIKSKKAGIDQCVAEGREKTDSLDRLLGENQAKLISSVEEINALANMNQLSDERLSSMERDEGRLLEEISRYSGRLAEEESNARELQNAKMEIDSRMKSLEESLRLKVGEHSEKTLKFSSLGMGIDDSKNELFRFHNDISSKTGEIGSLESLKGTLGRRREQLLSEKEGAGLARNGFLESLGKAVREISEIKESLAGQITERDSLRAKQSESAQNEKRLARELEELKLAIGQLSARKKTIEEMESNYEGYNGAVKFIMRTRLSGICGVAAELISVPRGYETAIETALGAALQNIVCEDDAAAQSAIRALKENKAGRLTFLPIGSIKASPNRDGSLVNEKGFIGYGADCVSFAPKYKGVMEYLLGRVIIVKTLEDAVRLSKSARGNLRFVTMEGEIINAAGAITGGTYKNRTANLLERRSEIDRLGLQISEMNEKKDSIARQLESLRVLMEKAQGEASAADDRIRAAEVELLRKESEQGAAQNAVADFDNSIAKWERELDSIENEQSGSDKMVEGIKAAIAGLREKIAATEGELEKSLSEYDLLKSGIEQSSEDITRARIAVSSCENEKANADSHGSRLQNSILEMSSEKHKREAELAGIVSEREALLSGRPGSAEALRRKEEEKASLESYIEELAEEKAGVARALAESTQEKDGLDGRLSELQSKKYELEIKKARNETQLDNYKDKLWEEFEVSYIQAIEFKKKEFFMQAALKESREIKNRIKELGEVNIGAIKEYETVGERHAFLTGQREDILEAMGSLRQIIDDMDKTIKEKFKESFDKIVVNFADIFGSLFGGGYAELRLEDETKPLESGIEIIAQPPGKKLRNINLMSGGEKTMTAIALMFAVLKTKPTPFCILDEIEAALDDANIDRFAEYLKSFEGIQFTLVTHQRATMGHADVLYGVTMPEQGISKVISLKFGDEFQL